jgi:hypothetical protein
MRSILSTRYSGDNKAIEDAIRAMVGPIIRKEIALLSLLPEGFNTEETSRRWWNRAPRTSWDCEQISEYRAECSAIFDDGKYVAMPHFEDFARGVFCAWVFTNVAILVRKPKVIKVDRLGHLHADLGPAIEWQDGTKLFYLNDVSVPESLVMTKAEDIDCNMVTTEKNVEVRREIVRKVGVERLCQKLNAKVIDTWTEPNSGSPYELLGLDIGLKEQNRSGNPSTKPRLYLYLKMKNPSVPGVYHLEGVPSGCKTVIQALNFRNGILKVEDLTINDWEGEDGKRHKREKQALPFTAPIVLT